MIKKNTLIGKINKESIIKHLGFDCLTYSLKPIIFRMNSSEYLFWNFLPRKRMVKELLVVYQWFLRDRRRADEEEEKSLYSWKCNYFSKTRFWRNSIILCVLIVERQYFFYFKEKFSCNNSTRLFTLF